jgi:Na+-translocating ferredoxin:NAD+ oxidoreductase subunit G
MGEMIKMVVVLTVLSVVSGGGLKWLEEFAAPKIEIQVLENVKGPAIREILAGATNDPVESRFRIQDGDVEHTIFVGAFDGKAKTVVLESEGRGYGGRIGLLVAVDVEEEKLRGISVTTHTETPGLGAQAKESPAFTSQFIGKRISQPFRTTGDGGDINAISGATITSRAVVDAANQALAIYDKFKPQLTEEMQRAVK